MHPPPLDACLAACDYAWPWPDCVADFKFRGDTGWAGPLAQLLRPPVRGGNKPGASRHIVAHPVAKATPPPPAGNDDD
ncbi:hypothetical protein ACEN8K_47005, partial [Variovorax sp. CT11-76]